MSLKEYEKKNLHDINLGSNFLSMTSKVQSTNQRKRKLLQTEEYFFNKEIANQ